MSVSLDLGPSFLQKFFCRRLISFQNKHFQINLSGIPSECQTVLDPDKDQLADLGPNGLQKF